MQSRSGTHLFFQKSTIFQLQKKTLWWWSRLLFMWCKLFIPGWEALSEIFPTQPSGRHICGWHRIHLHGPHAGFGPASPSPHCPVRVGAHCKHVSSAAGELLLTQAQNCSYMHAEVLLALLNSAQRTSPLGAQHLILLKTLSKDIPNYVSNFKPRCEFCLKTAIMCNFLCTN